MHEGNNDIWAKIEPAILEDILRYKKGELSGREANRVERSLAELDPDLVDDLSVEELERLVQVNNKFLQNVTQKERAKSFRWIPMAASVLIVGGILSLLYVKMNQGSKELVTAEHQADHIEEASSIQDAGNQEESASTVVIDSTNDTPSLEVEEDLTPDYPMDDKSMEQMSKKSVTEPTLSKLKLEGKQDSVNVESEESVADNQEESNVKNEGKYRDEYKKDKVSDIGPVFAIFEKYNDPSSRPSNAPKRSRAFATMSKSSTSMDSKYTFRRKASPQFPDGDKALIIWMTDNIDGLIKESNEVLVIRFTVTKKAKLTDIEVEGLSDELNSKVKNIVKKMPDWNKPDSGFEPLDIHYAIRGENLE